MKALEQALIVAGGQGSRLKEHSGDLPKPLVPICGKPVLEHQLDLLKSYGFKEIVLFLGYGSDRIQEYFGSGEKFHFKISYIIENEPLGTAGSILRHYKILQEKFLVLYGDTILNVNLKKFLEEHNERKCVASLFVHPNDHPFDSDLLEINEKQHITQFHPYPHDPEKYFPNLVSAALYILHKEALQPWVEKFPKKSDFIQDLFPQMLRKGYPIYAYRSTEYIKDMGTPKRYAQVTEDVQAGKLSTQAREQVYPVVFLDRDGTLNSEINGVKNPEMLSLLEGVGSAIQILNHSDIRTVLITNQPLVAKGECDIPTLEKIHAQLETLLGKEGAYLDRIYYCPHHPDSGFLGERSDLKISCTCRKPKTGLIIEAKKNLSIDLSHAWLIGDTTTDIRTAKNAGIRSILLRTGYAGTDKKYPDTADYVFHTLKQACLFITQEYPSLLKRLSQISLPEKPGSIILLGGLAHSGKSTLSKVIQDYYSYRGLQCKILSLDSWLFPEKQRSKNGNVRSRYNCLEILEFFKKTQQLKTPQRFFLPQYDRHTRTLESPLELEISPEDILLFEGVIALDIPEILDLADFRIFSSYPEEERKKRFIQDYLWRGFRLSEIKNLYLEREKDERKMIQVTQKNANTIFETKEQAT